VSADATDWHQRAEHLLQAAADVAPSGHPRLGQPGSDTHRHLFRLYLQQLQASKAAAESWWNDLITIAMKRIPDRALAEEKIRSERTLGPVASFHVIAVVRKFWLACAAQNAKVEPGQRVAPEEFILNWLIRDHHLELAQFLTGLPYWPMGQDEKGQWT
jgi:hypothetical protein